MNLERFFQMNYDAFVTGAGAMLLRAKNCRFIIIIIIITESSDAV